MLQAAVDQDLQRAPEAYQIGSLDLTGAALSHPCCTDTLLRDTLRRCSATQLAVLGRTGCADGLADAVARELRNRGKDQQPFTPQLLREPGPAQLVLREPRLHDAVFTAAVDCLPSMPDLRLAKDRVDSDRWWDDYFATSKAWKAMWEQVLAIHTDRHRQLVELADGTKADHVIREHLLGTFPWKLEPALLEEVATDDLATFSRNVLITQMCRSLRDGVPKAQVLVDYADDLAALPPDDLRYVEQFLDDTVDIQEFGCRATTTWIEQAAEGSWRYLLAPEEAKDRIGRPHDWDASSELLRTLGRRFAAAAVQALKLWEPQPPKTYPDPPLLRWLHLMLLHLPTVTDDIIQRVRAVLTANGPAPASRWSVTSHAESERQRHAAEMRASIERIIGDPAAATRAVPLGDPRQVTARRLAEASDDVLNDYLHRHRQDDDLVEKALLSFAWCTHRPRLSFTDVLARHSTPQTALLRITTDLRRRLGGSPNYREAWTRQILALPDCEDDLIRALPAWAALTLAGAYRYRAGNQVVTSVVTTALGESGEAWARFATNPASPTGSNAWLRLGDLLDAAVSGSAWPSPPNSK
ncbi:hypothetical protein ACVCAH_36185 [Micromonospora sp. LZ34]